MLVTLEVTDEIWHKVPEIRSILDDLCDIQHLEIGSLRNPMGARYRLELTHDQIRFFNNYDCVIISDELGRITIPQSSWTQSLTNQYHQNLITQQEIEDAMHRLAGGIV